MSNIYVPIDYSNVKDVIPDGEDIVYSSLAKGWHMVQNLPPNKIKRIKWKAHVLLTENNIAVNIPIKLLYNRKEIKQLNPGEEICFPISQASAVGKRIILQANGPSKHIEAIFTLDRDPKFESKESFKERSKKVINLFMDQGGNAVQMQKMAELNEKITANPNYSYKDYKADGGDLPKLAFNMTKKRILKGLGSDSFVV
ncbi:MAG: hypothetical protein ACFFAS_01850 [Promethearchaeota archaeon]